MGKEAKQLEDEMLDNIKQLDPKALDKLKAVIAFNQSLPHPYLRLLADQALAEGLSEGRITYKDLNELAYKSNLVLGMDGSNAPGRIAGTGQLVLDLLLEAYDEDVLSDLVSSLPILGLFKSASDAVTGKDLITGKELDGWERAFEGAMLLTLGVGSAVKAAMKVEKYADLAAQLGRAGSGLTRKLSPRIKSWGKDIALKAKFCRNSFAPSTKVWTKTGLVAIATLFALDGTGLAKQTPDEVWSYNERTQKNELKAVEHVFINEDDYITTLELFDPETRRNETITTTPEHPFYVSSKEKEPWTGAGELEVDDEIRKADGNVGIVLFVRTKLEKKTRSGPFLGAVMTKTMYNLSVSDNHNFFVGDNKWLTHNASNGIARIPQGFILYHYTDAAGAKAILETGMLLPDSKGRVFLTPDQVPSSYTRDALFAGNPNYSGKGTHVVIVKVLPETGMNIDPNKSTQYNELVHKGTLRNGRQIQIVGAQENKFSQYVSRIRDLPCVP
ncbi:MAG: pre-toxin TG domain-containing protein [Deinococcaceae bacterium]